VRALDEEERRLMIAYSKKEYESIDPVELPAEITDAQVTSGVGTDEVKSYYNLTCCYFRW
jgi:hypothetical protein